jgi:hypothetical protein
LYGVPGVSIKECPVSFITPKSIDLVQVAAKSQHAREASGASLYGPDLSKWPARAAEVMITLEVERVTAENARYERESLNRR